MVHWLNVRPGGFYLDATCNGGGHSAAILESCHGAQVLGIDKDESILARTREKLVRYENFSAVKSGFEHLADTLDRRGVGRIDGAVFDLGFSTHQIADAERGFSFMREGPLDMRFDRNEELTAGVIVNRWGKAELGRLFRDYAEIRRPDRVVSALIERRKRKRFETTTDLADFLKSFGPRKRGLHPATRYFQALRIAVNDELEALKQGLEQAAAALADGGHLVVISFHSLEDRIVKLFFRACPELEVLTKKPVRPSSRETAMNPESRSAKLRVAEKQGLEISRIGTS